MAPAGIDQERGDSLSRSSWLDRLIAAHFESQGSADAASEAAEGKRR